MRANLAVIAVGLLATVIQVALVRESLVAFGGNEIVLGLFFACWFLGIAIGARAGVPAARRLGDRGGALGLAALLLGLAACGAVVGLRLARLALDVPAGRLPGFAPLAGYSLLVIAPVGLMVGIGFPLASRLLEARGRAHAVGAAYWLEGTGAVAGGLAATALVLLDMPSPTALALISALAVALCAAGTIRARRGASTLALPALALPVVALLVLALLGGTAALDAAVGAERWQAQHPGIERIAELDTPYGHVGLGRLDEQYTLFTDGQPVASFPDEYAPALYIHLALCEHPAPRRVLLLDGVAQQFIRPALMHPMVEQLTSVELDPRARELVRAHLPEADRQALADPRVTLLVGDGRQAVKQAAPGSYDLIVAHLPPPETAQTNRFYTADFFREARRALADDGVLATSLPGAANVLDEGAAGMLGSVFRALDEVFPRVVTTPGDTQHHFASQSLTAVSEDPEVLGRRWDERGITGSTFTRHHFLIHFPTPERVAALARELRALARTSPANTDLEPRSYYYGLLRWQWFTSDDHTPTTGAGLAALDALPGWAFFLPLLLYAAVRLPLLRLRRGRTLDGLVAVGASGLAGMACSLTLLYTFQAAEGSVYSRVGLVLAAFMAGLAAGGAAITRLLSGERVRRPGRWLAGATLALGVFSLWLGKGLGFLMALDAGALPFLVLAFAAGGVLGLVFPLGGRVLQGTAGAEVPRAAGLVDAADHLGAMLGSLVSGVALLPLLGVWGTCGFSAAACGVAGGLMLLAEARRDVG